MLIIRLNNLTDAQVHVSAYDCSKNKPSSSTPKSVLKESSDTVQSRKRKAKNVEAFQTSKASSNVTIDKEIGLGKESEISSDGESQSEKENSDDIYVRDKIRKLEKDCEAKYKLICELNEMNLSLKRKILLHESKKSDGTHPQTSTQIIGNVNLPPTGAGKDGEVSSSSLRLLPNNNYFHFLIYHAFIV